MDISNLRKKAGWLAFVFPLVIYTLTLCPTVFWDDAGELIAAAYTLGSVACGTHSCFCPEFVPDDGAGHKDWCAAKKVINGSAVHITATFGMFLAGLVIRDVMASHADGGP